MAAESNEPVPGERRDLEEPLLQNDAQEQSTLGKSTIILAKTVIGAGIAAIPLTDAMLGWPLALAFLLLVAYATFESLDIIARASQRTSLASYPEVTRKLLGFWISLLLELAIVAFAVGLMIVYEVVIGDMLVGKPGFDGLLCGWLGGLFCSRLFVVGIVTAIFLLPAVSFRKLESSAVASWIGMSALFVWGAGTVILLVAAIVRGRVQPVRFTPDTARLGGSGIKLFANICAVIPVLTTAYSCQAAAPFVLAELRPNTPRSKKMTAAGAVAISTGLYALIALGSYLVFGGDIQSDVLHNYTPGRLQAVVPGWLAQMLYIIVRLSFLLGVMTLFPLMMFPARDGLVRILARRTAPLPPVAFYAVTYGITVGVFLVSVVTPSIWGPIQIIGATAGAVIGFLVPGLLKFKALPESTASVLEEELPTVAAEDPKTGRWQLTSLLGWLLVSLAVIQCITGIASQVLKPG